MEEQNQQENSHIENDREQVEQSEKPAKKFIQIKPFTFIMLMFITILLTAGLTIFALTFGEEKVVEVVKPVEREEFSKLYEAYDELKERYYIELDDETIIYGAINGMFDALGDPYSDYMNKEEAAHFNSDLSSSFQGIGAEIQERNGNIVVVSPIKNSPAEKAGIQPEDIILLVDGESIQGMSATEAVLLIRGEKGTPVTLTIQRGSSENLMEVKIIRDDIPIETVYGEMGEDKIAHIQITSFSEQTYKELIKILEQFEKDGMKSIVLDVRQNPGGYLTSAIDIANLFVEEGKPIVQLQERDGEPQVILADGSEKYDLPIVVLIDNGSASASEILAGALSESDNAKIVGLKSFGKGTVQTVKNLPDGSNLKYTNGKWLTPNGNWINEKGIEPDFVVDYPEYAKLTYIDPSAELKVGNESITVNNAEKMLDALGYDVGTIDNAYDDDTAAAVEQFQEDKNLKLTGIIAGETTYALMDALRAKIENEDPHILKAHELLKEQLESSDNKADQE
ncbi:peptidase S41 [Ureibacillus massiliensis 4400831 = CIP 108448 = CCUG 49529]|uniref:Peptidase S41 n=1 Tax=Ureibacillus massiliensis 4400831 = CIP 108448 = CCUG 49529 TaxID=1211035 RepID=A0A0A3IXY2_9BACL|nr:S41 family peptidase [Ureibacillus massiliensis]KGR89586.1 peptidase S41 [Ureibacillus massiliensis 4400831 = CIP 108448 = CCUG 49529]